MHVYAYEKLFLREIALEESKKKVGSSEVVFDHVATWEQKEQPLAARVQQVQQKKTRTVKEVKVFNC